MPASKPFSWTTYEVDILIHFKAFQSGFSFLDIAPGIIYPNNRQSDLYLGRPDGEDHEWTLWHQGKIMRISSDLGFLLRESRQYIKI